MESYEHSHQPAREEQPQEGERYSRPDMATKLRIQEALIFDDARPERHIGPQDEQALQGWIHGSGAQEFGKFWNEHGGDPEVKKAVNGWNDDADKALKVLKRVWRQFEQEQQKENPD